MKHAPVLPPKLYPLLDTGDYHLANAYQFNRNTRILEWFTERARMGDTVILDNGAHELGEASVETLFEAAKHIRPSIIICPDTVQDVDKTIQLMFQHIDSCARHAQNVMIAPQGHSIDEWIECTSVMLHWIRNYIDTPVVGVVKYLDAYDGGRTKAVDWLVNDADIPQEQIHLLGVWRTVRDVVNTYRRFPYLAGMDSTLPFATALSAGPFTLDSPKTGLDANDFKMTADIDWTLHARAEANIERMRKWVSQP